MEEFCNFLLLNFQSINSDLPRENIREGVFNFETLNEILKLQIDPVFRARVLYVRNLCMYEPEIFEIPLEINQIERSLMLASMNLFDESNRTINSNPQAFNPQFNGNPQAFNPQFNSNPQAFNPQFNSNPQAFNHQSNPFSHEVTGVNAINRNSRTVQVDVIQCHNCQNPELFEFSSKYHTYPDFKAEKLTNRELISLFIKMKEILKNEESDTIRDYKIKAYLNRALWQKDEMPLNMKLSFLLIDTEINGSVDELSALNDKGVISFNNDKGVISFNNDKGVISFNNDMTSSFNNDMTVDGSSFNNEKANLFNNEKANLFNNDKANLSNQPLLHENLFNYPIPFKFDILIQLGLAYKKKFFFREAYDSLRLYPLFLAKIDCLIALNEPQEASNQINQVISRIENSEKREDKMTLSGLYIKLAHLYSDPKLFDKAGEIFRSSKPFYLKGLFYFKLKDFDMATYSFEQALQINPTCEKIRFSLGCALIECDKLKQAEEILKQLKMEDPKDENVIKNLSYCYYRLNDIERTLVSLRTIALSDENSMAQFFILSVKNEKYDNVRWAFGNMRSISLLKSGVAYYSTTAEEIKIEELRKIIEGNHYVDKASYEMIFTGIEL